MNSIDDIMGIIATEAFEADFEARMERKRMGFKETEGHETVTGPKEASEDLRSESDAPVGEHLVNLTAGRGLVRDSSAVRWIEYTYYVLAVDADTWECLLVAEQDLKQSLHTRLCTCHQEWAKCETEGVLETIALLEDEDLWSRPNCDGWWEHDTGDGKIAIAKFNVPPIGREGDLEKRLTFYVTEKQKKWADPGRIVASPLGAEIAAAICSDLTNILQGKTVGAKVA